MLSNAHWTYLDTLAVLAVVLLAARVFDSGAAQAEPDFIQTAEARARMPDLPVAHPLPEPATARVLGASVRIDTAMRCIALAESQRQRACRRLVGPGAACRQAKAHERAVHYALWPKGRAGQLAGAFEGRQRTYRVAYRGLFNDGPGSSRLILRRDKAMCKRYREFFEGHARSANSRQSS